MLSALLFTSLLGAGPDLGTLREVRSTFIEDGVDRVTLTRTHRVVSRADGSLELRGAQPLRLSLDSVRRERGVPCLTRALSREIDLTAPRTVRTARACGLEETWTNDATGLAHAFTVQRPPEGNGGLTLRVSVEGPWHHQDDEGHVFKGPGAAELLRYGNAFVVRDGRRFPIPVVRVDGALELRVPRRLVDAPGAFPMHIDPVLSSEVPLDPSRVAGPPALNESAPAIAVNAAGIAMVVWVDERREAGTDIFGARFDPNGTLADRFGIPIVESRGDQRRPTICGQGDSFLIAWDTVTIGPDAGLEVHARELTANGALTPEVTVVSGSQPSLAAAGDGGASVLAWVDTASTVQVASMTGTVKGTTFSTPTTTMVESASRPFIAASDRSWFVVWETQVTGSATTAIRGLASGSGMLHLLTPLTAPLSASRPTVALSTQGVADLAHVFWQSGPGSIGGGTIMGTAVALTSPSVGTSPFVVRTSTADGVLPTLGFLSGMTLTLRNLNSSTSSLMVGARSDDLVLAAGPSGLFAAWTEGPVGAGDVLGVAVTSNGQGQRQPVSVAAATQRLPHVAWWDDGTEGLAVWVEGAGRIMGAKVRMDADGLIFGSSFEIANPDQPIQQLDVAATAGGPFYLVVWRQPGAVTAQLTTAGGRDGPPIALNTVAARFGPAVAWDEGGGAFRVAWSEGLGADLVSREVPVSGAPGALQSWASGVSDVDLTCLRSQCLLAWQVHVPRAVHARLLAMGAALFVQPMASQPSVAHDGTDFFLGWRAENALSFAKMDFGTGSVQPLGVGVRPPIGALITQHSLAPASPPVVVWSEETLTQQRSVVLQRLDFLDTSIRFDGLAPHVATTGINPQGVVVYQRYAGDAGINAMRAFGTAFAWPFDAGSPDAGMVDAGTRDAGQGDAGVVASDGGVDAGSPPAPDAGLVQFGTTGCGGCNATFISPLWWLVLLAFRRRK